jgi:hypothetical protein
LHGLDSRDRPQFGIPAALRFEHALFLTLHRRNRRNRLGWFNRRHRRHRLGILLLHDRRRRVGSTLYFQEQHRSECANQDENSGLENLHMLSSLKSVDGGQAPSVSTILE